MSTKRSKPQKQKSKLSVWAILGVLLVGLIIVGYFFSQVSKKPASEFHPATNLPISHNGPFQTGREVEDHYRPIAIAIAQEYQREAGGCFILADNMYFSIDVGNFIHLAGQAFTSTNDQNGCVRLNGIVIHTPQSLKFDDAVMLALIRKEASSTYASYIVQRDINWTSIANLVSPSGAYEETILSDGMGYLIQTSVDRALLDQLTGKRLTGDEIYLAADCTAVTKINNLSRDPVEPILAGGIPGILRVVCH